MRKTETDLLQAGWKQSGQYWTAPNTNERFHESCLPSILRQLDYQALQALKESHDRLLAALEGACKCAELQSEWDKPPYSKWYYPARKAIEEGRKI